MSSIPKDMSVAELRANIVSDNILSVHKNINDKIWNDHNMYEVDIKTRLMKIKNYVAGNIGNIDINDEINAIYQDHLRMDNLNPNLRAINATFADIKDFGLIVEQKEEKK